MSRIWQSARKWKWRHLYARPRTPKDEGIQAKGTSEVSFTLQMPMQKIGITSQLWRSKPIEGFIPSQRSLCTNPDRACKPFASTLVMWSMWLILVHVWVRFIMSVIFFLTWTMTYFPNRHFTISTDEEPSPSVESFTRTANLSCRICDTTMLWFGFFLRNWLYACESNIIAGTELTELCGLVQRCFHSIRRRFWVNLTGS